MSRISAKDLATAIRKVGQMSLAKKEALAEKIRHSQPQLLALGLIASRFGVPPASLETLLNIMLVCYQSMLESRHGWPAITEPEVESQLTRWIGAVQFADLVGPNANEAIKQYIDQHAERPLLAYVVSEVNLWLKERATQGNAADEDRFVIMAGITMVNCIAATPLDPDCHL
jgi:hypothetical protein